MNIRQIECLHGRLRNIRTVKLCMCASRQSGRLATRETARRVELQQEQTKSLGAASNSEADACAKGWKQLSNHLRVHDEDCSSYHYITNLQRTYNTCVNYAKSSPGHKGKRVVRNSSDSSIHNLLGSLPLLSSTADVFQGDARALAHPAENSVL
jgi:hypothetical protein